MGARMTRIANMKPGAAELYDKRFQYFLKQIVDVARLQPRKQYLYPVMDRVCFRDLEVALELMLNDRPRRRLNDNG